MRMRSALLEAIDLPESSGVPSVREAVADYAGAVCLDESLWPEDKKARLLAISDLLDEYEQEGSSQEDDEEDNGYGLKSVREDVGMQEDWSDRRGNLAESRGDETRQWLKGLV